MKILWITNCCPNCICSKININQSYSGGWLDYFSERLIESSINFNIIFPSENKEFSIINNKNYNVYMFPIEKDKSFFEKSLFDFFSKIITIVNPDIIHIHGTECYHSYVITKVCKEINCLDKCVVSIQGLASVYSEKCYYGDLDWSVIHSTTFHDLIKGNILKSRNKLISQGKKEIEILKNINNVIGRTEWDECHTKMINYQCNYFHCDEVLRKSFYYDKWSYDNCEKNSIFVSQSSYPIKGFHKMIEALKILSYKYDNIKLYVTGISPFDIKKFRISSYHKYLKKMIQKYNLKENIIFLGSLNEQNMKERYLKSNVFVLPSSIENSPNSLGEAMILGVPTIASDVGGVRSIFTDKEDGFMYPFSDSKILAYYIDKVFNLKDKITFNTNAIKHSNDLHNPQKSYNDLINIYDKLNMKKGNNNL